MTEVGLNPTYGVKFYREGYYKLIRYNHGYPVRLPPLDDQPEDKGEVHGKLSQSLSRARSVVFQLAICNDWDYFFTGTLDQSKMDRYDLVHFRKTLAQWIRDQRKKGESIEFLFIPERHKNGAYHMHGFIRGLLPESVTPFVPGVHPQTLIDAGFMNWPAYAKKFGYCSLSSVRDPIGAAHYSIKYVTKEMADTMCELGAHTYYASIGLKRAVPYGFIYGRYAGLDVLLYNDSEYCSTGFVEGVDWVFWSQYMGLDGQLDPLEYFDPDPVLAFTNLPDRQIEGALQLSLFDLYPEGVPYG